MRDSFYHGEVTIFELDKLPTGLKKLEFKDDVFILADSETTGNHHVLEKNDGIELFERDGTFFLRNKKEATVKCVIPGRHDAIKLKPGNWEIDKAKEFDYLRDEKRNVAD